MAHDHHHHHHDDACNCEHHHEHTHEHEHEHHHEHSLRGQLLLIAATAVLLGAAVWVEHTFSLPAWQLLLVYLIP